MIKYYKTTNAPIETPKNEEYTPLTFKGEDTIEFTPIKINERFLSTVPNSNKSKRYTDKKEFVSDLYGAYSKALKEKGIDPSYAYMLVAQDALESDYGSKYAGNYNYGNITAIGDQDYTLGNDSDGNGNSISQKFRNYNSLDEWVNAKIDLLNGKRYRAFTGDPNQFYNRVKAGGYATDPNYVTKLTNVYKGIKDQNGTKPPIVSDTKESYSPIKISPLYLKY